MLEPIFTLWGSPVTGLEILAFALALVGITLNVLQVHWAWPLNIASSALYGWLFYASGLFGESWLQAFFIASGFWGWYVWKFARMAKQLHVKRCSASENGAWIAAWLLGWVMVGFGLKHFTSSDVPFLDAFPTAGSLIATLLLAQKRIENWPAWIVINALSIVLFGYKGLYLTALLYAVFLGLAVWGWMQWQRLVSPR